MSAKTLLAFSLRWWNSEIHSQTKDRGEKRFAFPFFFLPADDNKLPVGRLHAAADIKPRSLAGRTGGWKVITQLQLSGRLWSLRTLVHVVTVRVVHS